jgi:hypothetical protein
MKKFFVFMMVAVCVLMMASCGNKTQQVAFEEIDSTGVVKADPTIYGVCGEATAMNTLQLLTDTGDTLSIDLEDAQEHGRVMGGLQTGDRLAVVPTEDMKSAVMVINQTSLLGNWVMPNPIDGSDEVGICIKEGGVAEGIEQSVIVYKTWRLVKGQLEIIMTHEGGSGEDELYLYDIVKLGPDSLTFKDSEETFEYSRQKPREEYGKDVKLEESSITDFAM